MTAGMSNSRATGNLQIVLALLIAALVIVSRTVLIAHAHSESADDEYHLSRGLQFLERERLGWEMNDPPLGEAILALPMWLTGPAWTADDPWDQAADPEAVWLSPLSHHRWPRERILLLTAAWKALLCLPLAGIVFAWCRQLYGDKAAWLALAMLLIEPTFAAHIGTVGLDVLGLTGIVLALWLGWRCFQHPTPARVVALGVATAVALLLKHTAIVLPAVLLAYALIARNHPAPASSTSPPARRRSPARVRFNTWLVAMVVAVMSLWPLTFFDISAPADSGRQLSTTYTDAWSIKTDVINPLMKVPLPAGIYLGSIAAALAHGEFGHPGYLLGEWRLHGWWYYFPVVATYKIPIGIVAVFALAAASLFWLRPRWGEWPLVIAAVAWAVFIMSSGINIGFRHFLPIYIFLIMLAARCVAGPAPRVTGILAWLSVVIAAIHAASFHPDYLSYLNWPRKDAHLAITDSNLDWGQSLKQVRRWLDQNPQTGPVYLRYFPDYGEDSIAYYLGDRVTVLSDNDPLPSDGTLIVSPYFLVSSGPFRSLATRPPDDLIGHSIRVFHLNPQPTSAPTRAFSRSQP
jgi:hypothetical protein